MTRVEIVDLAGVVQGVAEEFEIPASADGVRLEVAAEADLFVDGDPVALRRALANLLANAIRLAPDGSLISIRAAAVDDWVWMGVQDQGPGLSVSDQQRVFRRFWRGDNTQNLKRDGRSGLGLAIVKQIAETHGGTVRVESTLGEGSTFVIWLRRLGAEDLAAQPPQDRPESMIDVDHPSLTASLRPAE